MALSIIRKPEKLLEYPVVRSAMEKLNYYCKHRHILLMWGFK